MRQSQPLKPTYSPAFPLSAKPCQHLQHPTQALPLLAEPMPPASSNRVPQLEQNRSSFFLLHLPHLCEPERDRREPKEPELPPATSISHKPPHSSQNSSKLHHSTHQTTTFTTQFPAHRQTPTRTPNPPQTLHTANCPEITPKHPDHSSIQNPIPTSPPHLPHLREFNPPPSSDQRATSWNRAQKKPEATQNSNSLPEPVSSILSCPEASPRYLEHASIAAQQLPPP